MTMDAFLFSKKPLDIGMLDRAYRNVGKVTMSDTELRVDLHKGWFCFDFAEDEFLWGNLDDEEKTKDKILSLIDKPVVTHLEYKWTPNADFALSQLRVLDEVFVLNDANLILTLDEVQQRIRFGIEWQIWGGARTWTDLLVDIPGADFQARVVLLDDGRMSADQRIANLRNMLAHCMAYLATDSFAVFHGEYEFDKLGIEIVGATPPTPAMRAITSVSDPTHPELVLPVEFVTEVEFRERHGFVPRDLPSLRDRY